MVSSQGAAGNTVGISNTNGKIGYTYAYIVCIYTYIYIYIHIIEMEKMNYIPSCIQRKYEDAFVQVQCQTWVT